MPDHAFAATVAGKHMPCRDAGVFCFGGQPPAAQKRIQLTYDARRSGNAVDHDVELPSGLRAPAPLADAVFTTPVIAATAARSPASATGSGFSCAPLETVL